ncbi:MAG TPA: hypothetical protein VMY42_15670 [Thermoguttaceae bacterium]|nr:hypothetical protein [Thermoguttaceae bacterium]
MKCLILGAGATAYCDIANPDRRPPLVRAADLLRIVREPLDTTFMSSPFGGEHFCPFCEWAFRHFESDIEELFTLLFFVSKERRYEGIEESLTEKHHGKPWLQKALLVARKLREHEITELPSNILTLLCGMFIEEIQLCIGTTGRSPRPYDYQRLSDQHRELVRRLSPKDAVVSFNYDSVGDYALLNERLLNSQSFPNRFLSVIKLPQKYVAAGGSVAFFKPHGSFTWYSTFKPPQNIGVFFGNSDKRTDYSTPAPLILPYHCKEEVFDEFPVFAEELCLSLRAIAQCDELLLVGKQFCSSDTDLCDRIKDACRNRPRRVTYVNPDAEKESWVAHHDRLFNAKDGCGTQRRFRDLQHYLNVSVRRNASCGGW